MRTVEATAQIATTRERAIQAFLQLDALRDWWHVDRGLVAPCEGGIWAFAWERSEHGFKYVITGRITALDPARRLVISDMLYFNPERPVLGPMSLTVEAVPFENGCRLTVRQEVTGEGGDWDWYYKVLNWAWPEVLKELKEYLEHPQEEAHQA